MKILVLVLLLAGCAARKPLEVKAVARHAYAYSLTADGRLLLWVKDDAPLVLKEALEEICPTSQYLCAVGVSGTTYEVERILKN